MGASTRTGPPFPTGDNDSSSPPPRPHLPSQADDQTLACISDLGTDRPTPPPPCPQPGQADPPPGRGQNDGHLSQPCFSCAPGLTDFAPDRLTDGCPSPNRQMLSVLHPPGVDTPTPPPPHQGDTLSRLQEDRLPCPHPTLGLTLVSFLTDMAHAGAERPCPSWGVRECSPPSEAAFLLSLATGRQTLPFPSTQRVTVPPLQRNCCLHVCCGNITSSQNTDVGGRQEDSRAPPHSTPRSPTRRAPRHPAGRQVSVR